jgi:hypothetical protein
VKKSMFFLPCEFSSKFFNELTRIGIHALQGARNGTGFVFRARGWP